MKAIAIGLILIAFMWPCVAGILAFSGRMGRQGLSPGGLGERGRWQGLRLERRSGEIAKVMLRRLWPIPVAMVIAAVVLLVLG